MQTGDIVNVSLKGEYTPRRNVEIIDLNDTGLWFDTNAHWSWEEIDDIETVSYRPTFKDGTRVQFQGEMYVRHQNKWFKLTNYNDSHVASAVEAGNAQVLGD